MLDIRKAQMDAFRKPVRRAAKKLLEAAMEKSGVTLDTDRQTGDLLVTNALGHTLRVSFRDDGLPEKAVLATGMLTRFEYDHHGRLDAFVLPGGARLQVQRDSFGNITRIHRPGQFTYLLERNEEGVLVAVVWPGERRTAFNVAPGGQIISFTDRTGAGTALALATTGTLASVTDPLERALTFQVDETKKLDRVTLPDGSQEIYRYDEGARAATILRRDGSQARVAHDEDGHITRMEWSDGSALDLQFDGDPARLVALTRGDDRIRFERDDAGRIAAEVTERLIEIIGTDGKPRIEAAEPQRVECEYDAEGRLVALTTPHGDILSYDYDGDGRITRVVDWNGDETVILYNVDGAISRIRRGTTLAEIREYAEVGRLAKVTVAGADGKRAITRQAYQYDDGERLVALADVWGSTPNDRHSRHFTYDPEDRLLAEIDPQTRKPVLDFEYDAAGNIVKARAATVRIGPLDQPIRIGETGIACDDLGNVTALPAAQGTLQCFWSADGTLRETQLGKDRCLYEYDPLGRRILKTHGNALTRYGWAGHQLLWEEFRESYEAEPVRRDYLWLPGSLVPLAFREGDKTYWLQCDARGAVIRAYNQNGGIVWLATYDSFGQANVRIHKLRQPFRLPGHYHDDETGLHHTLARYYCPRLRVYLSPSPNWHRLGTPRYAYCHNDPWNRIAPFGLDDAFLAAEGTLSVRALVGATVDSAVARATGGDELIGALEATAASVPAAAGFAIPGRIATGLGPVVDSAAAAFAAAMLPIARAGDPVCIQSEPDIASPPVDLDRALLALGKTPGVAQLDASAAGRLEGLAKAEGAEARGGADEGLLGKIARHVAAGNAMSRAVARRFLQLADELGARLVVYPANPHVVPLLEAGHSPKPAFLRLRSIDEADTAIGASPDDLGKLGFFQPRMPDPAIKASDPHRYGQFVARYVERAREYRRYADLLKRLTQRRWLKVEKGVVLDTRETLRGQPNPGLDKAFVGDFALFEVTDPSGSSLADEDRLEAFRALQKPPVYAARADFVSWQNDSPDTFDPATFEPVAKRHEEGELPLGEYGPEGFTDAFAVPLAAD